MSSRRSEATPGRRILHKVITIVKGKGMVAAVAVGKCNWRQRFPSGAFCPAFPQLFPAAMIDHFSHFSRRGVPHRFAAHLDTMGVVHGAGPGSRRPSVGSPICSCQRDTGSCAGQDHRTRLVAVFSDLPGSPCARISAIGAMAQSSITKTSIRFRRLSSWRRLPSARAMLRSRNSAAVLV